MGHIETPSYQSWIHKCELMKWTPLIVQQGYYTFEFQFKNSRLTMSIKLQIISNSLHWSEIFVWKSRQFSTSETGHKDAFLF